MTTRRMVTMSALVLAIAGCGQSSSSAPSSPGAETTATVASTTPTGATAGSTSAAGPTSATATGSASGGTVNPATANDIAEQVTLPPLPPGWTRDARRSPDPTAQAAYLDYRAPGSSTVTCGVMVARWYGLPSSFAAVEPSLRSQVLRTPGAKVVRQESTPGPHGPATRLEIAAPARGSNPALHASLRTERPEAPVLLAVLANAARTDEPRCQAHALADRIRWRTGG